MVTPSSEHTTAPSDAPFAGSTRAPSADPTIGELVAEISGDLTQLVREEVALAKAEVKESATRAGKAAGLLTGSGYAGHLMLLMGSLAAVFGLAHVVDLAWAALIVTGFWALLAAVLFMVGRKRLKAVSVKPERTVETLKEDARWVRNPTS
ncbi:Putative Holin-X, holin superfamily III [Streptomyces sp. MnatMP-M77]|uniref:phage holin family protein n=1 Tax=unclassified Streptomyces TaxID=2593676 RepID=UPI00080570B6|nr:phage holin family protein [Streptomyces sp. MnatMP-M77]MYT80910.1 phage holin family protein [Streptomyces sp. SID8364]SBV06114.1 Putative Holin-X, holin superfamily III [Streptomyces sp. MnatMP-M77]